MYHWGERFGQQVIHMFIDGQLQPLFRLWHLAQQCQRCNAERRRIDAPVMLVISLAGGTGRLEERVVRIHHAYNGRADFVAFCGREPIEQ